jgi:hypothetical protein
MHRISRPVSWRGGWLAGILLVGLLGCGESPEITAYRVPKEPPKPKIDLSGIGVNQPRSAPNVPPASTPPAEMADPATGPDRMLGAIIVRPNQMWFFKLTGAEAPVSAAREPFIAFLKTVEFAGEQSEPTWKLPDGWTTGAPRQMRFATLEFESQGVKLELAISSLTMPGSDADGFLLMNLNRWLGQLSLPNSTLEALRGDANTTETIDLPGGNQAMVVNFRGKLQGGGMGMAPFAR